MKSFRVNDSTGMHKTVSDWDKQVWKRFLETVSHAAGGGANFNISGCAFKTEFVTTTRANIARAGITGTFTEPPHDVFHTYCSKSLLQEHDDNTPMGGVTNDPIPERTIRLTK